MAINRFFSYKKHYVCTDVLELARLQTMQEELKEASDCMNPGLDPGDCQKMAWTLTHFLEHLKEVEAHD